MLVTTAQLAEHLNDPAWVIFDCRHDLIDLGKGPRLYSEGHISGAHFASVESALSGAKNGRNGRHPLPSPETFAAFLGQHGVTASSTIVAYDDVGGLYAARLWWMARWIGLTQVNLLDGGLPKWVVEQRPLSREVPSATPVVLAAQPHPGWVWSAEELQGQLATGACTLIDARAAERYRGEVEPIDPVGGHIPGALNRFYKTNLNADLTFRPAEELKREFATLTQERGATAVVHQCGSGITACANIFAMEYAGLRGSKLYAGSWSEWVSDPARPVAKGSQP